jgi:hypothetical protein
MIIDENFKGFAPVWVNWAVLILIIAAALCFANILEIRVLLAVFAGLITVYAGAALLVFHNGYILSPLFPVLSPALIYIYQLTYGYVMERLEAKKSRLIKEKHQILMDSINYASVIQRGILPKDDAFTQAFSDHSVIWDPRDTVGGDIYWIKTFEKGSLLAVCDCTGHGVPGALLTALVVSSFEEIVTGDTCDDPAAIVWMLDQKLARIFEAEERDTKGRRGTHIKNGCDLAVSFIGKDGSVTVASGNFNIFICNGKEVTRLKGQRIYVGEGRLKGSEDVRVTTVPANADNKFYISSDGMYDQIGGEHGHSFGYTIFKNLILEHHGNDQKTISEKIWEAFENYRGAQERRDDFELITFRP